MWVGFCLMALVMRAGDCGRRASASRRVRCRRVHDRVHDRGRVVTSRKLFSRSESTLPARAATSDRYGGLLSCLPGEGHDGQTAMADCCHVSQGEARHCGLLWRIAVTSRAREPRRPTAMADCCQISAAGDLTAFRHSGWEERPPSAMVGPGPALRSCQPDRRECESKSCPWGKVRCVGGLKGGEG